MMDHNPYLKDWQQEKVANVAGKGQIEVPGQVANLVWQTRVAPPNEYENALGDAFETLFEKGAETPEQLVEGLNAMGLRRPDGELWSVVGFEAEMARLGA